MFTITDCMVPSNEPDEDIEIPDSVESVVKQILQDVDSDYEDIYLGAQTALLSYCCTELIIKLKSHGETPPHKLLW